MNIMKGKQRYIENIRDGQSNRYWFTKGSSKGLNQSTLCISLPLFSTSSKLKTKGEEKGLTKEHFNNI